jgi:site-specific recombinase XerD
MNTSEKNKTRPILGPKLPDQDDFLLELQNNNYSMQTVFNYARDLCILAVFLDANGHTFKNLDKQIISIYKGYLRNGEHLKDLDALRGRYTNNAFIKGKDGVSSSKGSRTNDKDMGAISSPSDGERNDSSTFLDDVYRKVYGTLGILDKPQNARARKKDGLDARSINRMLSAFRSYLKFRIDRDLEVPLPPDAVKLMKADKKESRVADLKDLIRLIESPTEFEEDVNVAVRNRAMLEILFSTGMRISELIGLNLEQISNEGSLFIKGKGKKERFVYLSDRAMDWLNKYLKVRLQYAFIDRSEEEQPGNVDKSFTGEEEDRETVSEDVDEKLAKEGSRKYIKLVESYRQSKYLDKFDSPALFVPFNGKNFGKENSRLSTNYFQEKIADYRRRLGILVPTSAHSLRHGFATYMAENDANPAAIQVLLGHESLNTTTRYLHASQKFAEKTFREKHPLK